MGLEREREKRRGEERGKEGEEMNGRTG